MSTITSPYHLMPLNELVRDVQREAQEIAGTGAEDIQFGRAGYFMRIYSGLYNGDGPLRDYNAADRLPEKAISSLLAVGDACITCLETSQEVDGISLELSPLPVNVDEDGEQSYDLVDVLHATQLGLEMAKNGSKRNARPYATK